MNIERKETIRIVAEPRVRRTELAWQASVDPIVRIVNRYSVGVSSWFLKTGETEAADGCIDHVVPVASEGGHQER